MEVDSQRERRKEDRMGGLKAHRTGRIKERLKMKRE